MAVYYGVNPEDIFFYRWKVANDKSIPIEDKQKWAASLGLNLDGSKKKSRYHSHHSRKVGRRKHVVKYKRKYPCYYGTKEETSVGTRKFPMTEQDRKDVAYINKVLRGDDKPRKHSKRRK